MPITHVATALHEEHLATLRLVARLEGLLGRPAPDASVAVLLRDIRHAVAREIGPHFRFEEEHLFPLLADAGAAELVALLAEEHAQILPLAESLANLAAGGPAPDQWRIFATTGAALATALAAHVEKEEAGMLPALDELLDAEADSTLSLVHAGMS